MRALTGFHMVGAALALVYLAKMLMVTASTGFEPSRRAYPTVEWDGLAKADFLLESWRRPRGKIVAVWGLYDYRLAQPINAEHPVIQLLGAMHKAGVKLQIYATPEEQPARSLLPPGIPFFDDPAACAAGTHAILQTHDRGALADINLAEVALTMPGYLYFDLGQTVHPPDVDAAGLQYMGLGQIPGPPWLDPDLLAYRDHLAEKTAPNDGILLLPVSTPTTIAGRARWFLNLNYLLFPRRFYLYKPHGASGASVQFRQWVMEYRKEDRWAGLSRWEPNPRELSAIRSVGAGRSLVADEIQAIQDLNIQWVTFFSMNSDFRLQDWETVTAEEAIKRSRKP
jgi:hypothetical protein